MCLFIVPKENQYKIRNKNKNKNKNVSVQASHNTLRHARITVILLLVSMTLLLLRNNCIFLHQSPNFVQFPLNYLGSRTILFGVTACTLSFIVTGAGATNICLSDYLFISLEASFVIFKNPSLSNNALILSVLCELVLFFS